jgi:signal transduction histidine kinase
MGLRAKLSGAFLLLLVLSILAVSCLEIGHTMRVMVANLNESADALIKQTYEQMRVTLAQSQDPPLVALRKSKNLRAFLSSSEAFGRGVVYLGIENPEGVILLAVPPELEGKTAPLVPSFDELRRRAASLWPWSWTRALKGDQTYERSRPVQINNQPFAVIKVGVSTALIAAEFHASVIGILAIGAVATVLSLLAAVGFGAVLMRPVTAIATGVEQLAAGGGEAKFQVGGGDELSTLAEKFNQLSQRIKLDRTRWENERGQFFNALRSMTDALLLLDSAGTVLFANADAQGRLGLPAGGLADGKPLSLLLGKEHPLARLVETAYAVGSEIHDVPIELRNGRDPIRFLVSIFSLGPGPEPPGLLVIVRDLEPVQRLENVVDYSGRLARLGGLISGIGHQIRNPLNAMTLQLALMSEDLSRHQPLEPRIETIRGEIRRLDQAVDALLRFMRPEQLKISQFDLKELLTEIVNQTAGQPGIEVRYRIDPRVTSLTADRALLAEAIKNIVVNAVEAMPGGGVLTVAAEPGQDDSIGISIADQGGGIEPECLDQIYQLYFTTKENGTGLGLSLATRAVDLHGGTIEVDSEVGTGTTFKIRLPHGAENPDQPSLSGLPN